MYRGRLWTMRQYAGFGTAEATNERFRFLLSAGQTGLSCAFDLPTQMGYDSDHPRAEGEVGKVGVAIDSIDDMRTLLAGLPLDKVSTSMTINATAADPAAARTSSSPRSRGWRRRPSAAPSRTTSSRSTSPAAPTSTRPGPPCAWSPTPSPTAPSGSRSWNTISISGYHIREAGSTAVQELAFTLANGIAYVEAALAAGLDVDAFAPAAVVLLQRPQQPVRGGRQVPGRAQDLGPDHDRALRRPRRAVQAPPLPHPDRRLDAHGPAARGQHRPRDRSRRSRPCSGGTQSLHTNGFDEALGLPTEHAAKLALRTQQVIAFESGVTDTVDPLAGSYFLETLTNEVERAAFAYIARIDALGGAVAAIEAGFMQDEIEQAAYEYAKAIESGSQGRRRRQPFRRARTRPSRTSSPSTRPCSATRSSACARSGPRGTRPAVDAAIEDVRAAARGTQNLLVPDAGGVAAPGDARARFRTRCARCSGSTGRAADEPCRPDPRCRHRSERGRRSECW